MTEGLYEQYKDALRRGHVAALRGRLDVAEAAYRSAATLAPDRALPWSSLGEVLRRQGRLDESAVAYDQALGRAPGDEAALTGRAGVRAERGDRTGAAEDLEALAQALESAGRTVDAADAARRALELAESRSRRALAERLTATLRAQGEEVDAVTALDRALKILEAVDDARAQGSSADATAGASAVAATGDDGVAAPSGEVGTGPSNEPTEPTEPTDQTAPTEPDPDPAVLRAVADALLENGDVAEAADRFLALAALHRRAGRPAAAMDACLALLAATPADTRLQLEIATLQLERGWSVTAGDKVRLLARLAELDADDAAAATVRSFATDHGLSVPGASPGA